jgi:hypothetical protein
MLNGHSPRAGQRHRPTESKRSGHSLEFASGPDVFEESLGDEPLDISAPDTDAHPELAAREETTRSGQEVGAVPPRRVDLSAVELDPVALGALLCCHGLVLIQVCCPASIVAGLPNARSLHIAIYSDRRVPRQPFAWNPSAALTFLPVATESPVPLGLYLVSGCSYLATRISKPPIGRPLGVSRPFLLPFPLEFCPAPLTLWWEKSTIIAMEGKNARRGFASEKEVIRPER